MSRYSAEFIQQYRDRYPTLYAAIMAAETGPELGQIVRRITKALDAGTLEYPACDGAIEVFKVTRREDFAARVTVQRSAADLRADRVLHTGARASNGRRIARRMGGR